MNLNPGSQPYKIILSVKFERSTKTLKKSYKSDRETQDFIKAITSIVTQLLENPRPENSRPEPIPKGIDLQNEWEFRKLFFPIPHRSGASGEGRLMYLINPSQFIVKLVWLYTHAEFKGRPADKDLKQILQNLLQETDNE